MVEVPRGSIEWPLENEQRWVSVHFINAPTHRLLVHAQIGFVFEEHGQAPPELVAMEAKMMDAGGFCGCHVLALWWQSVLVWKRGIVRRQSDPENPLREVVATFKVDGAQEEVACTIEGDALSIQFFCQLVKVVCPGAQFGQVPFNKPLRDRP
jgi:hypothetical protein